jgi:hypothetical protein
VKLEGFNYRVPPLLKTYRKSITDSFRIRRRSIPRAGSRFKR